MRALIEDLIGNHGGKGTFFSLAGSCGDVAWANLSLQRAALPGKGASVRESRTERKEAGEVSDDILQAPASKPGPLLCECANGFLCPAKVNLS